EAIVDPDVSFRIERHAERVESQAGRVGATGDRHGHAVERFGRCRSAGLDVTSTLASLTGLARLRRRPGARGPVSRPPVETRVSGESMPETMRSATWTTWTSEPGARAQLEPDGSASSGLPPGNSPCSRTGKSIGNYLF